MPEFPLPCNVKDVISRLPVKDQVVIRSYIAGLRDTLKEYKEKAERKEVNGEEDDAHAHYHGHDKCTADHGHDGPDHHGDAMKEETKAEDSHDHADCGHDHSKDDGHSHEHKHEHKKKPEEKHGHDHSHNHDEKMAEADTAAADVPAWKKRAMESGGDAAAAPFGGSWGAESSVDATK